MPGRTAAEPMVATTVKGPGQPKSCRTSTSCMPNTCMHTRFGLPNVLCPPQLLQSCVAFPPLMYASHLASAPAIGAGQMYNLCMSSPLCSAMTGVGRVLRPQPAWPSVGSRRGGRNPRSFGQRPRRPPPPPPPPRARTMAENNVARREDSVSLRQALVARRGRRDHQEKPTGRGWPATLSSGSANESVSNGISKEHAPQWSQIGPGYAC